MSPLATLRRGADLADMLARHYCHSAAKRGLVLGAYIDGDKTKLTKTAEIFNSKVDGKLLNHLNFGSALKAGKSRVFWGLNSDFPAVALVGLGSSDAAYNADEEIDDVNENIRIAAAAGCKALNSVGVTDISLEDLGGAKHAAEGACLSLFSYQANKNEKNRKKIPNFSLYEENKSFSQEWDYGLTLANSQNYARTLMETPANQLTPMIFAEKILSEFSKLNISVKARDRKWAEEMKMFSFLSVANGSAQPPVFLEMSYKNSPNKDEKPIVLVGKGVTFDSGGISIKPSANMAAMRGDMGGAACVSATFLAAATLKLPINLIGLIPLTENMPGGRATKPGDVVTAMNGKTILVDNTDAEGRLILADALCYSQTFNPAWVVDIATLTGAMHVALGGTSTGAFTKSLSLWNAAHDAGIKTGDRFWRFPLWKHYKNRVTEFPYVDVHNVGKGKGGGSCTAAAFLAEFAPTTAPWMHLDIASVMDYCEDQPYLTNGMTGRPTRTLIELIQNKNISN